MKRPAKMRIRENCPSGIACKFFALAAIMFAAASLNAADQPQWGQKFSRNMVSRETGLPDSFEPGRRDTDSGGIDPESTKNVKWVARLGGQTNASPVVAGGKIFVGTNNQAPRDSRIEGDRGVLICFDEATGRFLWQLAVPKMYEIKYSDWHFVGISSPPSVEDGKAYLVTNRCEVVCLDVDGMADGNDGPYQDEGRHMMPAVDRELRPVDNTAGPFAAGKSDADIVWLHDMVAEDDIRPHNASNCSVLIDGDLLYICTSNGVEWTHNRVANPHAPTLIVLDKKTGRRVARDDFDLGADIIHGQWCSPALGLVDGRKRIFLGTGKGYLFGFEPPAAGKERVKTVWSFNGHPLAQTQDVVPIEHGYHTQSYEFTGNPVFYKNRVYVAVTQDPWHSGKTGWFVCVDATSKGDVTRGGLRWAYKDLGKSISTASIAEGLVYIAGFDGRLHCLDVETGKPYWVHEAGGPIWSSTLAADGKVYLGTGRRTFWVLRAGKTLEVIGKIHMRDRVCTTPTAANGVLYVATYKHLYAIGKKDGQ